MTDTSLLIIQSKRPDKAWLYATPLYQLFWQRERERERIARFLHRDRLLNQQHQRWLWRVNRPLARKLSREEHWTW